MTAATHRKPFHPDGVVSGSLTYRWAAEAGGERGVSPLRHDWQPFAHNDANSFPLNTSVITVKPLSGD